MGLREVIIVSISSSIIEIVALCDTPLYILQKCCETKRNQA